MHSKSSYRQYCTFLRICAIQIGGFLPTILPALEPQSIAVTITHLVEAEEFKAKEREQLASLPIGAVPILVELLMKAPDGRGNLRQFGLLAAKLAQFESKLEGPVRDKAVNALLMRMNPSNEHGDALRIKIQATSAIVDQRIVEGARRANAALESEEGADNKRK
ncbi:MAG: hypothetical protein WCL31_06815 [Actinomycetes bacterium]